MVARLTAIFGSFLLLAGCASTAGIFTPASGNYAPPGVDPNAPAVDGLLVGHRLMAAEQYELALKSYLRAAVTQGLNAEVLSSLGSANLQLGRLGQAENLLRRAVSMDETFPPAWNNLGVVLMEQGKFSEAERVFRTAFALDSGESVEIRENLSLALAKLKKDGYAEPEQNSFALQRRGTGEYQLLSQ
jgi:Flp pilus assembly protein TadD